MQITTSTVGTALVVRIADKRIDAAVAARFKDRMVELAENPVDQLVLDLSNVDFVDSSGLGAVVGTMKHLGNGRQLDLVGLTPTVAKLFRVTRMDRIFRIYPDVETAMNGVAHAG